MCERDDKEVIIPIPLGEQRLDGLLLTSNIIDSIRQVNSGKANAGLDRVKRGDYKFMQRMRTKYGFSQDEIEVATERMLRTSVAMGVKPTNLLWDRKG